MKIEALETIKHHPYYLDEGDTKNMPDDIGEMFVKNGWAKNLETGEVNERSDKPVTLDIHSTTHTVKDNLGG